MKFEFCACGGIFCSRFQNFALTEALACNACNEPHAAAHKLHKPLFASLARCRAREYCDILQLTIQLDFSIIAKGTGPQCHQKKLFCSGALFTSPRLHIIQAFYYAYLSVERPVDALCICLDIYALDKGTPWTRST